MNHTADKSFISAIGSAGNLIMAVCMFSFALFLEDFLQKRASYIVATLINKIGVVTMGIYFIHVIFLRILNYATRNWIHLQPNSGSLLDMTLSADVYFIISELICLSVSKIKYFNKLF